MGNLKLEEKKTLLELLKEYHRGSCKNTLEGMFSAKQCDICDLISALNDQINPPDYSKANTSLKIEFDDSLQEDEVRFITNVSIALASSARQTIEKQLTNLIKGIDDEIGEE